MTDVLASLGHKLDSLDLTDAERTALEALLPDAEVEGFSSSSFGAKLPTFGSLLGDDVGLVFKDKGPLPTDPKGITVSTGGNGI